MEVPSNLGSGRFFVKRVVVSLASVKAMVTRSTRASAQLENRELPADYLRPEAMERHSNERRSRWARRSERQHDEKAHS